MLVTPGELTSITFERSCSNGEGVRVNGIWVAKVRHPYMKGKEHVGKRLFIQDRSVYLF